MPRRMTAFALSFLVVLSASHRLAMGGQMTITLPTQSIPMTLTDWGPGTGGIGDPEKFAQFDPKLGTLDEVVIEFGAEIRQDFKMIFVKTPIITTLYVSSSETTDPKVLADPAKVQQLTDGPVVTLKGPDGLTPLFSPSSTTLPVAVRIMTEQSGTFSSLTPSGQPADPASPNYIKPEQAQFDLTRTLDPAHDPSLLAQFIGTGNISLDVTAVAHSSFFADSGNGFGQVITRASATVKVQYIYTPQAIPEPSGLILLGLGTGLGLLAVGRRHRVSRPGASDRM